MRKQIAFQQNQTSLLRQIARMVAVCSFVLLVASTAPAISRNQYHQNVRQAITALETLAQSDENESVTAFEARDNETVRRVDELLPANEKIDDVSGVEIDNSWLGPELRRYTSEKSSQRYDLLRSITERLKAIDERLTEFEKADTATAETKENSKKKMAEILSRPEYLHQAKQESALARLVARILKWIQDLFPKPKPMSVGSAGIVSKIAQIVVIVLAIGVIIFVLAKFLPRVFRSDRPKKKRKEKARIVLGERLEPEQSARDLLAEAEAMARRGELRAAIRRAYIALLVELGDRKILSLAQYKTNRDYLRAMRDLEPLYGNVKQLTDSFERHWYGLAQASETDWRAFRAGYEQALAK
jgi:hypothetical protein